MSFWTSPDLQPVKQNRFRIVFTPSAAMSKRLQILGISVVQGKSGAKLENPRQLIGASPKRYGFGSVSNVAAQNLKAIDRDFSDFWWWVKTCSLPSYEIAMSEYQLVNYKFKFPGMLAWNDVNITMVDKGNVAELLTTMLSFAGYTGTPNCDDQGISKTGFAKQGDIRIQIIDSSGSAIKQWKLEGWFFRSVKFGDMSYESDDFAQIDLTLGYDYAVLENASEVGVVNNYKDVEKKDKLLQEQLNPTVKPATAEDSAEFEAAKKRFDKRTDQANAMEDAGWLPGGY